MTEDEERALKALQESQEKLDMLLAALSAAETEEIARRAAAELQATERER